MMDFRPALRFEYRAWLRPFDGFPLLVFLLDRAALSAVSFMGLKLVPSLYFHEGDRIGVLQPYPSIDGLCRWDCGWFELVASSGYLTPSRSEVWPLYPLWARFIAAIGGGLPMPFALLLASNLSGLAAYYAVMAVFRRLATETAARWSLVLFAAYPFAFFHAAGYAESTGLLLSALATLFALRRQHYSAGVALTLATLARAPSLYAGGALFLAQLRQRGFNLWRTLISRDAPALLLPFLGPVLFIVYLGKKFDDPLIFWHAREKEYNFASFSIRKVFETITFESEPVLYLYMVFALIPLAGTILLFTRRAWLELAGASALLALLLAATGAWGLGRFSAACWPAFLPLGRLLGRNPTYGAAVVAGLGLCQGLFFFLFSHQWPIQ